MLSDDQAITAEWALTLPAVVTVFLLLLGSSQLITQQRRLQSLSADATRLTVMAIAMTAAGLVLCGLVILVGQLLLSVRTIQSLADLAALAASDVSMGVVSGRPCDAARAVVKRQGNYSVYCLMNGPEASVTISAEHSGITLSRTATAGPSVHGVWSGDESTP